LGLPPILSTVWRMEDPGMAAHMAGLSIPFIEEAVYDYISCLRHKDTNADLNQKCRTVHEIAGTKATRQETKDKGQRTRQEASKTRQGKRQGKTITRPRKLTSAVTFPSKLGLFSIYLRPIFVNPNPHPDPHPDPHPYLPFPCPYPHPTPSFPYCSTNNKVFLSPKNRQHSRAKRECCRTTMGIC
jgi:hypothetical protein